MDSKTVNKLIRSEVWPLLRKHGFSVSETRTARRYRGHLIDVVNFQSFDRLLADGIGCTTFSFALNLGVYVTGSAHERRLRRDKIGRLAPPECACQFRCTMKKRTPVDGFAREDIFYIDPEGYSAAACINEVRQLLIEVALRWFDSFSDLSRVIAWMEGSAKYPDDVPGLGVGIIASPTSYFWKDLLTTLRLLKHSELPSVESGEAVFTGIDQTIGSIFDFSSHDTAISIEKEVLRIREFWEKLLLTTQTPPLGTQPSVQRTCLMGSPWTTPAPETLPDDAVEFSQHNVNEQLWSRLKTEDFSEFTERLAHRTSSDAVEVVEIAQVDRVERKALKLPDGLFHVGLGVFWPLLSEWRPRVNRAGNPRPTVRQCQLAVWLMSGHPYFSRARSAFGCAADARDCLEKDGLPWLSAFRQPHLALSFLKQNDWEIFSAYPMMRGFGSKSSTRRLLSLAFLAHLFKLDAEAQGHLRQAEETLQLYPEHLRPRLQGLFDRVSAKVTA